MIQGDGTSLDIWLTAWSGIDEAVAKSDGGKRAIWFKIDAEDEVYNLHKMYPHLYQDTLTAVAKDVTAIAITSLATIGSQIRSTQPQATSRMYQKVSCVRPLRLWQKLLHSGNNYGDIVATAVLFGSIYQSLRG